MTKEPLRLKSLPCPIRQALFGKAFSDSSISLSRPFGPALSGFPYSDMLYDCNELLEENAIGTSIIRSLLWNCAKLLIMNTIPWRRRRISKTQLGNLFKLRKVSCSPNFNLILCVSAWELFLYSIYNSWDIGNSMQRKSFMSLAKCRSL